MSSIPLENASVFRKCGHFRTVARERGPHAAHPPDPPRDRNNGVGGDDEIDIRFEGHADEPDVSARISLKDQVTGNRVLWNEFAATQANDKNSWVRAIPTVHTEFSVTRDFVASSGRLDVPVEMTRAYPAQGGSLTMEIDLVGVVVVDN